MKIEHIDVRERDDHPLVKAVAELPPLSEPRWRPRCAFILDRGTRCKSDAPVGKELCLRHQPASETVMARVSPELRRDPMPPTAAPMLTRTDLPLPDLFLPQELKFVCSREQKDFNRFALVWSLKFPEYELDTIVETKDDDTHVNVWLRLKKESLDASKSAA